MKPEKDFVACEKKTKSATNSHSFQSITALRTIVGMEEMLKSLLKEIKEAMTFQQELGRPKRNTNIWAIAIMTAPESSWKQ